jgi:hypothetical protein
MNNECWLCTRGAETFDLLDWRTVGEFAPWGFVWPLPPHGIICILCANEMRRKVQG